MSAELELPGNPHELTDEEMQAALERIERRKAAESEAARRPAADPVAAVEPLAEMLARIQRTAEAAEAERRSLPCYQAAEANDLGAAAAACRAVDGHLGDRGAGGGNLGCRWRQQGEWCAIEREGETVRLATERMQAAGVPARLRQRVLASVPAGAAVKPTPLRVTQALHAARAFAAAPRAAGCPLEDGGSMPFTGSEWCLTLAGPPGTGKSVAAAYVVARCGGLWLSARHLSNPKYDLGPAERAELLVLDDLGTEYSGASEFGVERAAALLELRHEEARRTVITTNLKEADIGERYKARVASRLREQARLVVARGADMRGAA